MSAVEDGAVIFSADLLDLFRFTDYAPALPLGTPFVVFSVVYP